MHGHIFDIKKFAIHDGPGIRTTIFLNGCPLKCSWCHNPESINNIYEDNSYRQDILLGSMSKKYSVEELFNIISGDLIFYEESGGGVTFSGGEPLIQIEFLEKILEICKKNNITTTVDTCGYVKSNSFQTIYHNTDLFLYDLKLFDDELHTKYTSVSNNLIKANLEFLNSVSANVIIRVPLIPDITDTDENMEAISNYLQKQKKLSRVDLLPYNKLAEDKYKRLNLKSKLGKLKTQTPEKLERTKCIVESFGLNVELKG